MNYLRQNTAAAVKYGPLVDDGDGSPETALTIQKADVRVSKNGGNMAAASADQGASDAGAPHDEVGVYDGSLDATDTNTLGRLRIDILKTGCLSWWKEFEVIPQAVYDSLHLGSDFLQVDAHQIENLDASDQLRDNAALGVLVSPTQKIATNASNQVVSSSVQGNVTGSVNSVVTGVTLANGAITSSAFATDAISAAAVSAGAVTKIQNGLALASALATLQADVTTLVGRITAARAGYWDNLNVGGAVASQADINALNQSASRRLILTGVAQYERPESGSSTFTIELRTYDGDGAAVNADSTPTLTATGNVSGSLAGNLSAASNPSTGVYRWTYTVLAAATVEQIRFDASALIAASTFTLPFYSQVVDQVSSTWTATDQAHLTAIFNKLPSKSFLSGTADSDGSLDAGDLTDILNQAASALVTYDPATGAESAALDTKLNTLLSGVNVVTWKGTVPGNLDANGFVPSNLAAVNGNAGRATTLANWLDANLLTAVKSATDKFETTVVLDGSVWKFTANALEDAPTGGASLTLQQIVDGVWDEAISGHLGAGTTGAKLNSASAAGDPLANEVPGTYPIGTAGYVLGTLVTTTFSTPVPAADDCIETQQFDVGEKKRIFAMIGAGIGNLTIQGTPKVSLLNRSGQPVHGISNINVTGSDAGALSSVRAWYDLDTATPPSGGAIAPGKYTLCFSMTVLKSGGGTETRVIKQPIKVDPLA